MTLDEDAQARFLIAEARRATALDLDCDADIPVLLDATLDLTERVLAGDTALLPDLIRFLDDPEMKRFHGHFQPHRDRHPGQCSQ